VCQAVFSNMADDEEAVVLACTSFIVCALCVHVNKKEKRRHAEWVKDYLISSLLHYQTRIADISETVMSTCEAIVSSLKKDYINESPSLRSFRHRNHSLIRRADAEGSADIIYRI